MMMMMMNFKKAAFIVLLFVLFCFFFVFVYLLVKNSQKSRGIVQTVYRRNKSEDYYPSQVPFFLNQFFDTFIWTVINKIPPTP